MRRRFLPVILTMATLGLAATAGAVETFKVDSVHSALEYRIKYMNVTYLIGRFNSIEGNFTLNPADPSKSAFDFTVKSDSLDTANAGRDGHLKGPDFFNAKQFPTITFKSKSVAPTGRNVYKVKGDLTLHGVTKEVTVTVEHTGTGPGMPGANSPAS